jgi:hypothetical protein
MIVSARVVTLMFCLQLTVNSNMGITFQMLTNQNSLDGFCEKIFTRSFFLYQVLRRQQYMTKFKNISSEICRVLNELPYFSLHIPAQTWIQVFKLCISL